MPAAVLSLCPGPWLPACLCAHAQVVGPLLPPATRAKYDALACHMATCASDAATAASRDPRCSGPQAAAVKVLQRQALELLLTSVLAPCRHRPPYLGQVRGCGSRWAIA